MKMIEFEKWILIDWNRIVDWPQVCLSVVCLFNIRVIYLEMTPKQLNVKHAERWLQKLKNQNLQSYKDITKFLRKYQKTDDQHDCYLKMSHTLLSHVELTKEINFFLEDGNKFVVSRPDDQKLKDFMGYVKKNRPQVFNRIISMIQDLSKSKGEGNTDVSKLILPKLKEIVMGDPQLQRLTEQALDMTDQQIICKKNLEHLKVCRAFMPVPEEIKDLGPSQSQQIIKQPPKIYIKQAKPVDISVIEKEKKNMKQNLTASLTNSIEEKVALKQFRRNVDQSTDRHIMKVLKIFTLNIITRNQLLELLNIPAIDDQFFELLRDIVEARELIRRKQSIFKPLADSNFSSYERCSPSYVNTPITYPTKCSGKTGQIRLITNDKWISVPYGSQENQHFSVRNKNANEINLLKAEDQRYDVDLLFKKYSKTKQLIEKYLKQKDNLSFEQAKQLLRKSINLGTVQLIYKCSKESEKQEVQQFFRDQPELTCRLFIERIDQQIAGLKEIKQVYGPKIWSQIANKNFYKALDLKGFEFKKNEKQKLKNTFFMTELNQRSKLLQNRGQAKSSNIFQQKKSFFSIFNSFSTTSKSEKCHNRTLPTIQSLDLNDVHKRPYYPLMILSFEDQETCKQVYSLLIYYIQAVTLTDSEKYRSKVFLEHFLIGFLGWKIPAKKMLSPDFNEESFFQKINNMEIDYDCSKYFTPQTQVTLLRPQGIQKMKGDETKEKKMYTLEDTDSKYSYFPRRSDQKKVIYSSQHVYCLIRYFYTLYQRFLKLKEVAQSQQHIQLFQLLFYSCIKTKQGVKFQQNLNILLGKHAYLFSTVYKIFDSLSKSIVLAFNCLLTFNSFKFAEQQKNQDLYFLLINRFCLANNLTNNKLIRITYNINDKVVYFNYMDCYYRAEDMTKDVSRKRVQIARNVQIYTVDDVEMEGRKRVKTDQKYYKSNKLEYIFEGTTIKMQNHNQNEDLLVQKNNHIDEIKQKQIELKRIHHLLEITQ